VISSDSDSGEPEGFKRRRSRLGMGAETIDTVEDEQEK